ncbi:MAG TPA: sigma 54-interacting transcriptional regulator [Terracidiphilus sp.]|nr:sigma 54-interacting transcriptional regulator [Terracidiphilus sp.]
MPLARANLFVDIRDLPPMDVIFGKSSLMAAAREKLERIAETTVPILLQGESGTGKDIFAKLLHARSNRSNAAWVKVTCPAIPHSLIESELFGYEKGAFTGAYATKRGRLELAHMGTLFLDEVSGLDMSIQAKLLQVLQDGSFMRVGAQESRRVDTRLVCAANGNLRQQTEDGGFRLDFFFRINAVTIDLPPLRQRLEDLPALIDYFLDQHSKAFGLDPKPLSREVIRMMQRYKWPGNIRQLENMIRSYVLIGDEEALAADLLPTTPSGAVPEIDLAHPISLKEITKAATRGLEREIILKVLQANGWSRRKTAKWLNISYRSLLYKLQDSEVQSLPGRPRNTGPADTESR